VDLFRTRVRLPALPLCKLKKEIIMATNLTMKDLESKIQSLNSTVTELEKRINAMAQANSKLMQLHDEVEAINKNHDSANKRIQSDIQQIVERLKTGTMARIL